MKKFLIFICFVLTFSSKAIGKETTYSKDLFDKASKTGQTNLAIKEFSELVEELTTLPIQNSKITFKTLNHILQDTKYFVMCLPYVVFSIIFNIVSLS